MKHLVLDTNVLVIILSKRSAYHWLLQDVLNGAYHLSLTTEILLEYEEVLSAKYHRSIAQTFIASLVDLPNVHLINIYFRWNLITIDPDDNKFVDCAIAAGADVLITEDGHFDVLKKLSFPIMPVASLEEFSMDKESETLTKK